MNEEVIDSSHFENHLQPSFSNETNVPSEQTGEIENAGWDGSNWPNLGKIESDHLAQVEPMEPDFSKRKSEEEQNDK